MTLPDHTTQSGTGYKTLIDNSIALLLDSTGAYPAMDRLYVGSSPADPGVNNVTVQGILNVTGGWISRGAVNDHSRDGGFAEHRITAYRNDVNTHTLMSLRGARGTESVPLDLTTGDSIGYIRADGYVNGGFLISVAIMNFRAGTVGATTMGGSYRLSLNNAAGTAKVVHEIDENQNHLFNAATKPTGLVGGIAMLNGTGASAALTDGVSIWADDIDLSSGASTTDSALHIRSESGVVYKFGSYMVVPVLYNTRVLVQDYADTANTLTITDVGKKLTFAPTVTRIQTLPTTSVQKGDEVHFINTAAFKITIESSDGDDILSFQDGSVTLMALQDTPTDRTHWIMRNNHGGASPTVHAHITSTLSAQNCTSGLEIILAQERIDNNSNHDISNGRFTPTVPGMYSISLHVRVDAWTPAGITNTVAVRKNGSTTSPNNITDYLHLNDPDSDSGSAGNSGFFDMDGITDYISLWVVITTDTSVDIGAGDNVTFMAAHRINNS